jgi:hypothetical protein
MLFFYPAKKIVYSNMLLPAANAAGRHRYINISRVVAGGGEQCKDKQEDDYGTVNLRDTLSIFPLACSQLS